MNSTNQTMIEGFRLKGLSDVPELQLFIFLLVFFIYFICIGGNLTIILLVSVDRHLHTPMYFFLSNLSAIDIVSTTTVLHRNLIIYVTQNHLVSTSACLTQLYIFSALTTNGLSILAAMSYDRYVAICRPLHYCNIMSRNLCALLASVSWGLGFLAAIPTLVITSKFTCYISKEIDHYFCDVLPILDITCSDTTALNRYILVFGSMDMIISLSLTITPYVFIISCILRIQTSAGRHKAFYTCSSHFIVVVMLYSSMVLQYVVTGCGSNMGANKFFSLFNTAIAPMMNPLIYSLKNKDVKSALRRKLKLCRIKY